MSDADRCVCCGEVIPEGSHVCQKCQGCTEQPAKFMAGALVKLTMKDKGYVYYNYVVDSYFNQEINTRMYRLMERIAMPVYREDWLEIVSADEIERVNRTGLLEARKNGGFEHPLMEGVNM